MATWFMCTNQKATYFTAKSTWLKQPRVKVTAVSGLIEQTIEEIKNMIIVNQPLTTNQAS